MKKIIKTVLREHFRDNPKLRMLDNAEWYAEDIATEIVSKFRADVWFLDLSDADLTAVERVKEYNKMKQGGIRI